MIETTITLTRYREPNDLMFQTLDKLAKQHNIRARVLFLDQNPDDQLSAFCRDCSSENIRFQYRSLEPVSLSHARNAAVRACNTSTLLFIDADAFAKPDWACHLASALQLDGIGIAGGKISPVWHKRPLLITRSRIVHEQYSLLDHGAGMMPVKKIVGANFGIHIGRLGKYACFDESLGRREGILLGGEETDLCRRALNAGLGILYQGKAAVDHQVLPERISYRWIMKRLFYTGVNRALQGGGPSPTHRMTVWDYLFLPLVAVPYTLGYWKGKHIRRLER